MGMDKLIDIETYKKHLIKVFRYEIDRDKELERKKVIENMQESLMQVLQNTKDFILYLLEQIKNENDDSYGEVFFVIDIDEITKNIYNGCSGSFPSDILVHPLGLEKNMWISLYLLRKVFENFDVYDDYDEVKEINEDEDCGVTYIRSKIVINGSVREFQKIYKAYFPEQNIKRVHTKK